MLTKHSKSDSTHSNLPILRITPVVPGSGFKNTVLEHDAGAHFTVGGEAIFNPFQWVFDTSPQFISGRVQMQYHCSERLAE